MNKFFSVFKMSLALLLVFAVSMTVYINNPLSQAESNVHIKLTEKPINDLEQFRRYLEVLIIYQF